MGLLVMTKLVLRCICKCRMLAVTVALAFESYAFALAFGSIDSNRGEGGTLSHFLLFDLYMEIERGPHKNNCAIVYYTP